MIYLLNINLKPVNGMVAERNSGQIKPQIDFNSIDIYYSKIENMNKSLVFILKMSIIVYKSYLMSNKSC